MKHLLLSFFCLVFAATTFAQKVDTLVTETWLNGAWQNQAKIISVYDATCRNTSVLTQTWKPETSEWINAGLLTYTYNGAGHITKSLTQTWEPGSSTWINVLMVTNTYNASSQLTSALSQSWSGTAWLN